MCNINIEEQVIDAPNLWQLKIAVQLVTSSVQSTTEARSTDAQDWDTGELLLNCRMLLFTVLPAVAFMT